MILITSYFFSLVIVSYIPRRAPLCSVKFCHPDGCVCVAYFSVTIPLPILTKDLKLECIIHKASNLKGVKTVVLVVVQGRMV